MKPNWIEILFWLFTFKIMCNSPVRHPRRSLLLKLEIYLIDHYCFILSQNEFKFKTAAARLLKTMSISTYIPRFFFVQIFVVDLC